MYHIFFIHSSVDGHLGCFYVLAIVNSSVMNIGVHVSFQTMFFSRYVPRNGIAGSYGSSIFIFSFLDHMSCLYILEINPLSVASFANIFSHSVGCLVILFMVSFAVQMLLSLIRSYLFMFLFISITLGDGLKKILLQFMSKSVLPIFSSKSFTVSGLTFRSLTILSLFLRMVLKDVLILLFLNVAVQFSQHHLLKRLSLLHFIFLPPLL